MRLNQLIRNQETQEEYLSRTYWMTTRWPKPPTVLVWESKSLRDNPDVKPKEIIPLADARRYFEMLEPEAESEKGE